MMRFVRTIAAAAAALSIVAGAAAAQERTRAEEIQLAQASKRAPAVRHTGTHVYLLRGFMDIFSTGMDDLGSKLSRSGVRATVHNHGEFGVLAEGIIDRHRRGVRENVVIVGHSLGGNDAFRMAERLGEAGVTVPLIIAFDPTASMAVPRNVSRVVNFYSSTNGWGAPITRGPGFRGSLSNVDLSRRGEIGHTDIDKSPALHSQSIGFIRSIGGRSATAAAPQGESTAPAKDTTKDAAKDIVKDVTKDATKDIVKDVTKDAAPETTASAPKKPEAAAPAMTAKPAEKTETAASKPEEPKTNN